MNNSESIVNRQNQNKKAVIEQLRTTPIIEIACKKVGIGRASYYRWKNEDEAFTKEAETALTEGLALINDLAESKLISAIQDQNMTGIIFWLKNRHKDYSTKVELSGKIKTENYTLTPEQEKIVKKALELASINNDDYDE